jgi:hypothetical protein
LYFSSPQSFPLSEKPSTTPPHSTPPRHNLTISDPNNVRAFRSDSNNNNAFQKSTPPKTSTTSILESSLNFFDVENLSLSTTDIDDNNNNDNDNDNDNDSLQFIPQSFVPDNITFEKEVLSINLIDTFAEKNDLQSLQTCLDPPHNSLSNTSSSLSTSDKQLLFSDTDYWKDIESFVPIHSFKPHKEYDRK